MYRRILVAHDGSDGADKALRAAIDLAKRCHAELHLIAVEELPRFPGTIEEVEGEKSEADHRFEAVFARARSAAKARRMKIETHAVVGHVVPTIVDFVAKHRFDALVVGFMGHTALYNRIVGSTTDRLVDLAPCAVFVVK